MRHKIITYLEAHIKKSIENDVKDVALWHARPQKKKEAGFFGIPRQVFCYIDFLGQIAFGSSSSTQDAEDFIKSYFPSKYHDYAELLYSMWRHGTVHEYKPKTYFAEYSGGSPKKVKVAWLSNNDNKKINRNVHLEFFLMVGKRNTLYLCMNTCQLVDDLLCALDKFVDKLKADKNLERGCQKRFNIAYMPQSYKTIRRAKSKNAVFNQILLAWQNRSKIKIDEKGRVIKR